jgi:hypothetical protein
MAELSLEESISAIRLPQLKTEFDDAQRDFIIELLRSEKENFNRLIELINSSIPTIVDLDDGDSPYELPNGNFTLFVDTDTSAITLNLPAGAVKDYLRIINTGSSDNDITVVPNGSELLTGANASRTLSDSSVIILEFNDTKGWW